MSIFTAPSYDGHELVTFGKDERTGLRAIIAVHSTVLGPAVGGCRMYPYASEDAALDDVLRLSRGMTYKSALAGLPFGGGKSVIIGDPRADKTPELMRAMGDGDSLQERGILYCPDFLINAGGIIDVHHQRLGSPETEKQAHIRRIESNLAEVLCRADESHRQTNAIAEELAEDILRRAPGGAMAA